MRRFVALALWAYFGWYAAALACSLIGLPSSVSPVGAVIMAGIALVDWRAAAGRSSMAAGTDAIADQRST